MQPGDLVTITRASIGIPAETIGFVLSKHKGNIDDKTSIYDVDIVGENRRAPIWARKYLGRDLEVIK
jgi:hypothetical protein